MKEQNRKYIRKAIKDINSNASSKFNKTKHFVQHGNTSVMKHCISVADMSLSMAQLLHINVDKKSMVRGALLHDYFLYDWHEPSKWHSVHGFRHPFIAFNNAKHDFNLNNREKDIIIKHMFPLVPIVPVCRESWIVTTADKLCSTRETMYTVRKYLEKYGIRRRPVRVKVCNSERRR